MPTFNSLELQEEKDSLLIYEVGSTIQRFFKPEEKRVHCFRLNKTLALIMRHWNYLKNNIDDYNDIHEWGLRCFPYRYGQRIYRSILSNDKLMSFFPGGAMFIEDIIKYDKILIKLGVKIRDEIRDHREKSSFYFSQSSSIVKNKLFKSVRMNPKDLFLIRQLAGIYAPQQTEDIESVSTCPTESDCILAQIALINLFHQDMEIVQRYINPSLYTGFVDQGDISSYMNWAIECAREIKNKRKLYERSKVSAYQIYTESIKNGYSGNEVECIVKLIDGKNGSNRIDELGSIADIMIALVEFCRELLSRIDLVDDFKYDSLAVNRYDVLDVVGISKSDRERAIRNAIEKKLEFQYEVANDITVFLDKFRGYLKLLKLPSKHNSRAVFNPQLLL
jgi:hypothetical protein